MKNIRSLLLLCVPLAFMVQSCVTDVDGYSETVLSIIDTLGVSVVDEPEEVDPTCTPDENTSEFSGYDYEWDDFECEYDWIDDEYTLEATTYWSSASLHVVLRDYPENGVYYTSDDGYPASDEIYMYMNYPGLGIYNTVEGDSVFVQKFGDGTVSITFCDILLDIGASYLELYGNITYDGGDCD